MFGKFGNKYRSEKGGRYCFGDWFRTKRDLKRGRVHVHQTLGLSYSLVILLSFDISEFLLDGCVLSTNGAKSYWHGEDQAIVGSQ